MIALEKRRKFKTDYLENSIRTWSVLICLLIAAGLILMPYTYGVGTVICFALANCSRKKRAIFVSGFEGEKKVRRRLAKLLPKDVVVLHNIAIQIGDKISQVDHLVVGPGGIMVIETKNHSGTICVDPKSTDWHQVKTSHSGWSYERTFYSPLRQNAGHQKAVQKALKKAGLYGRIESMVVFASDKVNLKFTEPTKIVKRLEDLSLSDFTQILDPQRKFPMNRAVSALRNSFVHTP